MKLMRLLDGCDDWINPIVIKELRQAVKNRMVTILLLVFLVLQLAVVTIALLASSANPADDWSAAPSGSTMLLSPFSSAIVSRAFS